MKTQIKHWLQANQSKVEQVILQAAEKFFKEYHRKANFVYDLNQCEKEALNLRNGKDLCYDRPTIGLSYSLWYLGRRINTSMNFMIDLIAESVEENKPIEILDLGAGTGAVQVALGLCLAAIADLGYKLPKCSVINIDISPFMLQYNKDYLSPTLFEIFPTAEKIESKYSVNSWVNTDELSLQTPVIVASYLFDHEENQKEITLKFKSFVDKLKPAKIVLITSNQENKRHFLDSASALIRRDRSKENSYLYQNHPIPRAFLFKGNLEKILTFRANKNIQFGTHFSTKWAPQWDEYSFYGRVLTKETLSLALDFGEGRVLPKLDLYIPEIVVRRDIRLNDQQKDAAKVNHRPTVITGPAGCGKSIVITERIKNLCEESGYSTSLNILLTTFNKALCGCLAEWLNDLLDESKFTKIGYEFYFGEDREQPNIRIMHFDILPTRIGNFQNSLKFEPDYKYHLQESIETICISENIKKEDFGDIFNPSFLYDEYVRVIYGQQLETPEAYYTGQRKGRPYRLQTNGLKRKLIWLITKHCLTNFEKKRYELIHTRRHKLLKAMKEGRHRDLFTHIFVDEFQDCTLADYQIFYGLLKDNNNLVVAGDFAQAVHLGKTASIPREEQFVNVNNRMGNRDTKKLEGSYRLPFRISQCIRPLSEHLHITNEDSDIITPYKGSPPGARPIAVYGKNEKEIWKKILWILWYYNQYQVVDFEPNGRKKINILERDNSLCNLINNHRSGIAVTDSVLKLKGLEKECIVWSTRTAIKKEDAINYVYTILTRTSSILIIALFPNLEMHIVDAIKLLNKEYLMIWDEETRRYFDDANF